VCGNLLVVGSFANIVGVERARQEGCGCRSSSARHAASDDASLLFAIAWLLLLGQIDP
jgi:hypothetical protein